MKKSLLSLSIPSYLHKITLLAFFLLTLGVGQVLAADKIIYTLKPTTGSNNGYANNCDVEIDDITWNITGNSQMVPWRIGGKSITNTDRMVYSKTAMGSAITKVELTVVAASSITVNSLKLLVASDADFNTQIDEVSATFTANSTITFMPSSPATEWATGAYYKFVFNVTVSGSSNKFVEFSKAEFYAEEASPSYSITAQSSNDTHGTVSLSGSTITATPASGYRVSTSSPYSISPSGSATVSQSDNTFTVTPSANTTITINFEAIPSYTVNWIANGTNKGTQTAVEGTALTEPTTPTSSDCDGSKVFVGWTTHANYSDADDAPDDLFSYSSSLTMPKNGATYYAVFATASGGNATSPVNIAYSGSTTNMQEGNNASTFGLNNDDWTIIADKGGNSNYPGLNKDGDIRLYYNENGGNTITITAPQTIISVELTFTGDSYNNAWVKVGSQLVTEDEGAYQINATSFTIGNANTSNVQVRISNIKVNFSSATYSDYSTTCGEASSYCLRVYNSSSNTSTPYPTFTSIGSNEYTMNFTIPDKDGSSNWPKFWVGKNNAFDNSFSKDATVADINLVKSTSSTVGLAAGATGTLHIWDNNIQSQSNLFIKFDPSGYGLVWGADGQPWTSLPFTPISSTVYETDVQELTTTQMSNWKYYVGFQTASGYVYSGVDNEANDNRGSSRTYNLSNMRVRSDASNFKTTRLGSESSTLRGKFRIWVDNATEYNFYCHFVPTHRVVFKANWPAGASGTEPGDTYSTDVSVEESQSDISLADAPTAPAGYTFDGWYDAATGGNKITTNQTISAGATSDITLYAHWSEIVADQFELVTNASSLEDGDEIIIVNTGGTRAMSTTQNTNNRGAVSSGATTFEISGTTAYVYSDDVQVITLENYTDEDNDSFWELKVGSQYLYAAGASSNNYLRSRESNSGGTRDYKGDWLISIDYDTSEATITSQNNNTSRDKIKNNGDLFSCYESGQTAVKIYRKISSVPQYNVSVVITGDVGGSYVLSNPKIKESIGSVVVTTAPDAGYKVSSVTTNNGTLTNNGDGTFTLTGVTADVTVTITYASLFTVTVTTDGHGSCTLSEKYVDTNGSTTLTLSPHAGYGAPYTVTKTSGTATVGALLDNTCVITGIQSDVELSVGFTKLPVYSVTFNAGTGTVNNRSVTTLSEQYRGNGVTTPTAVPSPSCAGEWEFYYWTTTEVASETTTAPTPRIDKATKYVPESNNITLYAVYRRVGEAGDNTTQTDVLTYSNIGVTGTNYTDWSNLAVTTSARYAGCSAGGNNAIQLRTSKGKSGIVSTTTGGYVKSVSVQWNSNTSSERILDIYGSNSAYTASSNLYADATRGKKIGSIAYGTTTPLDVESEGEYAYIGIRSNSGALYLDKINIEWITGSTATNYYWTSPVCVACEDPVASFSKSEVTLTYPYVGTYNNTLSSTNSGATTYKSSDKAVATVDNSGNVTVVGLGTTTISVHQGKTGGKCAVDLNYTIRVKESSINVVEVNNNNDIIIEHDFGENASASIQQLVTTTEGNIAEEVFFSKYFEASGSVKMLAVYNGTGKAVDPTKLRIRIVNDKADKLHIINLSEYLTTADMPNGKELIFYSWDTDNETDINIMNCAEGKADMSSWIEIAWEDYDAMLPAIIFGGDEAIVLEQLNELTNKWEILDIIGALTADGTKADQTNAKNTASWADHDGWYTTSGNQLGVSPETNDYGIGTVRCLLVRKFDVLSGKATRNTTTGNLGTGDFNTLASEWYGKQVGKAVGEYINSCNSFTEVGKYDYYKERTNYEPITSDKFTATNNGDGTMTIHIDPDEVAGGLAGLSCNFLKINITNADHSQTYATLDYRVPIIVANSGTQTNDAIFTNFDDCSICDVAVLGNATLESTAGGKNSVHDVEVYPGAKLTVPSTQTLDVNQLILRSKGDDVPLANIQGTLNRFNPDILFDKRIDGLRWYFFTLPYDCAVSDIMFRDGSTAEHGVDFLIQYYDGEERAREATSYVSDSKHWKPFTGTTLKAGVGYIVAVEPKTGHTYSELRFPMKNANLSTSSVSVPVHAWGGDKTDEELNPSHKGWNLIGNPFLYTYNKDEVGEPIKVGLLEYSSASGDFILNTEGNVRYLYKPYEGGQSYYEPISVATEELPPFTGYFVQIGGNNPSDELNVSFAKSNVKASMPHRLIMAEVDDSPVWLAFNITNSRGESDEATLLVSDQFTDGYDMMNDLVKWRGSNFGSYTRPLLASRNTEGEMAFNALPDATARTGVALNYFAAERGQYTLSLSRKYSLDNIDEVWLYDSVEQIWHDLLLSDYSFSSARTDDKSRFTLTVRVRRQPKITTDISDISGLSDLRVVTGDRRLSVLSVPAGADLWIFDSSGKLIDERLSVSADRLLFDVPASGVYNVRVVTADSAVTLKAVVK